MKNISLLCLLVSLTCIGCGCRNFGLKSGVNMSSISGDNTENYSNKFDVYAGGFVEICINDEWAVQPELLYSSQGAKLNSDIDGEITLGYINAPILVKANITEEFIVEAGPQLGYLIRASEDFMNIEGDLKDSLKDLDFGVNIGLNYETRTGYMFGVRYYSSLMNIDNFENTQNLNWKNSVFQIGVGVKF